MLFLLYGHFTRCLMSEVSGGALVTLADAMNLAMTFSRVRIVTFNRK